MSWKDKLNLNECFIYCETPKTREEIMGKFNLTSVESWHASKYLMKLNSDMIVEKNVGITGRAYLYKTRKKTLEEVFEELDEQKYEEASNALENL